jgi:uncharacterized protein with PIN domain
MAEVTAGGPRFIADTMLGRLARWLRFLGYDTSYPEVMEDARLLENAMDQGRVLLTRDKLLAERARAKGSPVVHVKSDDVRVQLAQVYDEMGLSKEGALSRCSICNLPLEKATKDEVKGRVPDGAFELHTEFWRCPGCGRFYWEGTHVNGIRKEMDSLR